ncbi:porin family protein [Mariniflexile sp.]|uniref:porin family protein n=1 Tax=Mariniflexile sp. TaxID=1979402 RepID=UPI00356950AA
MKTLLLSALITVFGLMNFNAQEVKFGAKAGLNFASIGGDDVGDQDGRTAFHVGGIAEIVFSDKFSFQPELLYSSQGSKETYEDSFEKGEYVLKLEYINIPLMAKFYVAEGFSIEAGPQIGLLLSSKYEYEYFDKEDSFYNESGEEDAKDYTSGIDFGINAGVGYKLASGLNFGARYNLGLSNIWDFEDSDDFKQHNNVIQIYIGFMF